MRKSIVSLALLLAVSMSGCAKTSTPPPPSAAPGAGTNAGVGGAAVDTQAIFKQNCISCHGNNLEGGVGPNLTKVGAKYTKDQIVAVVSNGRGAMPTFKGKLSDNEIYAIADWLSAKR